MFSKSEQKIDYKDRGRSNPASIFFTLLKESMTIYYWQPYIAEYP